MGALDGQLALVTGASRGIGEASATALAREGARLVICSRKREGIEAAAERICAAVPGAQVTARVLNTGDLPAIPDFAEALVAELGLPDILVNNAAANPMMAPLLDVSWPAWEKTFAVNVQGPFELSRQLAQRWIDRGVAGRVVNVTSVFGLVGAPWQGVYAATKASIISLTRTMAVEWGGAGIRVNAVAPGLVDTRFAAAIVESPELSARFTDRAPLGRVAQPEEIAGMVVFLAGPQSSFATGQVFTLDGGYLAV
jgi:NAD(P)-dependent dehydrogenase (short-subunit alcohol dehydrogenase family)